MVLTLSHFGWWCSSRHQIAQRPHLHLQWHCLQLALVVYNLIIICGKLSYVHCTNHV